ncbi:universal stress protein [Duganella sp. FT92W]|uniref:Universal stress protein n=1 Tax=Pseudoduganella rivuli TaxID=2666085 RepID=A0A7X2LPK4_9BURK|nr:universal stress protein [Pseudoduganella rivuli]MRV70380.1 universal stress protein [Pseudoduganella rivuli]
MAYRTILVHADNASNAATRFRLAAELASREEAHLVGAAMSGIPSFISSTDLFEGSGVLIADYARHVSKRVDQALALFDEVAAAAGAPSREQRRGDGDEYSGLCLQARYADLLVLGQANPDDRDEGGLLLDLPEHVILNSGRPVLMVPYAGQFPTLGERPLIAWNGSVEAVRAVTAAIPLLRRAGNVTVAMFNPEVGPDAHGEEPGADIAQYLARHGVKVEVMRSPTPIDVGNSILSLAATIGADLLVMGCYGHSRFREKMLGGATSTVLATMTLPVLMAH